MKHIWQMTPTQHRQHRIDELRREYSCSVKDAEKCVYMTTYWNEVSQAAYDGNRIPNVVLDRMDDFTFYSVMKRARAGGHDMQYLGHMRPEARRNNKDDKWSCNR